MRITRRLDVAADRIRVRPQMQPAKTLQCDHQAGIPVAWSIKGAILSVKHQMATIDGLGQSRPSHDGEARDKAAGQKPGIGDGQRRGCKGSWRHGGDPVRLDLEPDGFLLVSIARNRFQTEFSSRSG